MASLDLLTARLVAEGNLLLAVPPVRVVFTGDDETDTLLNALEHYPHAFVLACPVDRQIRAEFAWKLPGEVRRRLGSFEIADLCALSEGDWLRLLREPTAAHRMPETMAVVLRRGVARIVGTYNGDASRIWSDTPSSATLVRRFLGFHGAGPKIATMAANILTCDFHIPLRDCRYIDISADVHVVRVMTRLGFVDEGASTEDVIYAAREANSDFPGVFDLPLWDIGRQLCRPSSPKCAECRLSDLCTYASDTVKQLRAG